MALNLISSLTSFTTPTTSLLHPSPKLRLTFQNPPPQKHPSPNRLRFPPNPRPISLHVTCTCSHLVNQEVKPVNDGLVSSVVKPLALGLVFALVSFVPFSRVPVRSNAFAAPPRVADVARVESADEKVEKRHEYSEYTKKLLETVSNLIRVVEEARKGGREIKEVEKVLAEVKARKRELEGQLLGKFYAEFEELKREKEQLGRRTEGIIDEVLRVKRRQERGVKEGEEGEGEEGNWEGYEEAVRRLEEEYAETWERAGQVEDRMRRKETMALSVGYRELAFIERESKQVVEALRIELRRKNLSRYEVLYLQLQHFNRT